MDHISFSKKQKETLDFIKAYTAKHKCSPTVTEMAKGLKLNSLRSVTQRLEQLEKKGLIRRDSFKHRGVSLLGGNSSFETIRVPVIASAGCDAAAVYSNELSDEYLLVDRNLTKGKTDLSIIKAVGNSMQDAGIRNGDYVLVEVTENVSSGDRVVALLGDMAVIKRLRTSGGAVILEPEAAGYDPIVVSEENVRFFGKVLSIIPFDNPKDEYRVVYDSGVKHLNDG